MDMVRLVPRFGVTLAVTALAVTLGAAADAEVLHEKVQVAGLKCVGGVCTSGSGAPVAVDQNGELIYPPHESVQPKAGEPVYTPRPERVEAGGGPTPPIAGDPPPERRDVIHPDRDTGPEPPGKHFYHEVFNPTVFPYKRMTALDGVELGPCTPARAGCEEEQLVVRNPALRPIPLVGAGKRRGDRDAFWGSIVVDLEPGKWLPIPTPGASTSVLSYESDPPVRLGFALDSADNLFVMSPSGGRHRLTYLVDAPADYFGGELPSVRLGDEPTELLPPIPPSTRERVRTFLARAHLSADRSLPLQRVLDPMVAWFRAFETGELPPGSDNSYLDLACSQKGCCRHRSYAFAITAMAMGIPARYVENELHVFVEVYVPRLGWRRINLGGATLDEEVLNTEDKTPHQPRGGDPFPQPPQFTKAAEPSQPPHPPSASGSTNANANGGNGDANGGNANGANANANGANGAYAIASANGNGGLHSGPESRDPGLPYVNLDAEPRSTGRPAPPTRAATHIVVSPDGHDTFRGEEIDVSGTIRADGADSGGLAVEIYLQGPGGALRVGAAITNADGSFRATLEIPRNLPLGDHRVVARTPGDEKRAPSRSR